MTANCRRLLGDLIARESSLPGTRFVAPCLRDSRLRLVQDGITYSLRPNSRQFEGWGEFEALDACVARFIEEADPAAIDAYLKPLPRLHCFLLYQQKHQSWFAYPANIAAARRFLPDPRPFLVQLVRQGEQFDPVIVRQDGPHWLFEDLSRRSDPTIAARLRERLADLAPPEAVHFKGVPPELRTAYALAHAHAHARSPQAEDEARVRAALALAGGQLLSLRNQGEVWAVRWRLPGGTPHCSFIAKNLTVHSAGICLSGRDSDFDLQCLVGVFTGSGAF